jgi:alcohol dehydrogenase class IV
LRTLPPVAAVLETLEHHNIHVVLYDYVRVEPTDASLRDAIDVAQRESCDAFVAVGGGSTIDTRRSRTSTQRIRRPTSSIT